MSAELAVLAELPADERIAALRSARALLSWSPARELTTEQLAVIDGVGLIQLLSAGFDHVDVAQLPPGPAVAGNAGAFAEPMAEHVLAMALALAKRLPQKHAELTHGEFVPGPPNRRVAGSTCGIVGFGGIGIASARLFAGLGARILAVNTTGRTLEPVAFCGTLDDLDRVLAESDILVLCLPLSATTRGLIGRRELDLMKPDAILVNVARGAIVEQAALFEHLRTHPDFSAAIDTWWEEPRGGGEFRLEYPFFELPNVLGSPHNSPLVPGIEVVGAGRAAQNIRRFLRGEAVSGLVPRAGI